MPKKTLILATLLILAVIVGGVFWVVREKSEKMALEKVKQEESVKQAAVDADFAKYNKVLSRNKITGVKDLEGPYKKVTVSNREVTFSFEVPDKWLTETRNSGEVAMNEEDLREFFMTKYVTEADGVAYIAYTPAQVSAMSFEKLRGILRNQSAPEIGIPNASVSSGGTITYYDGNWKQIDFRILSAQDVKKYYGFDISREIISEVSSEGTTEKVLIDGKIAKIFTASINGEYGDGNKQVYIPLIDLSRVVTIYKQGEILGEFESDFSYLIQTMKFE